MEKSIVRLRPHHSLCIQFFVGKGYSDEFIREMTNIIKMLQTDNPIVTLERSCDIVCRTCPNNIEGHCRADKKVHEIDIRCLEEYGLSFNEEIRWSKLKDLAYNKIISEKQLDKICRNCQWIDICRHTLPET